MTLEECYRALGGSYSDVLARLVDDKMITKYLNKFTKDTSYRDIFAALENNDYETAFRAAHTLKGICLNLGLENLYKAAYKVTGVPCCGFLHTFIAVRGFSLDDNRKKRYNNLVQINQPAGFKKGTSNDS